MGGRRARAGLLHRGPLPRSLRSLLGLTLAYTYIRSLYNTNLAHRARKVCPRYSPFHSKSPFSKRSSTKRSVGGNSVPWPAGPNGHCRIARAIHPKKRSYAAGRRESAFTRALQAAMDATRRALTAKTPATAGEPDEPGDAPPSSPTGESTAHATGLHRVGGSAILKTVAFSIGCTLTVLFDYGHLRSHGNLIRRLLLHRHASAIQMGHASPIQMGLNLSRSLVCLSKFGTSQHIN